MSEIAAGRPAFVPLLPHGEPLFDELSLQALVLAGLAPSIDTGAIWVRAAHATALLLVRDGAIAEAHLYAPTGHHSGEWVVSQVQGWRDAGVRAARYTLLQADVAESLLHGELVYDDLRLEWAGWSGLLADLNRRGGAYVIELEQPSGRGVTCVEAGRRTLTYTERASEAPDATDLDQLALAAEGSVRVRRLAAAALSENSEAALAAPSTEQDEREDVATPDTVTAAHVEAPPEARADSNGGAPPSAGIATSTHDGPVFTIAPAVAELLPELSWIAPWHAEWRDVPAVEEGTDALPEPADSLPSPDAPSAARQEQLIAIAQRWLRRSSPRVESVVRSASLDDASLTDLLEQIRALSIRGVMPQTLDQMVDEMASSVTAFG